MAAFFSLRLLVAALLSASTVADYTTQQQEDGALAEYEYQEYDYYDSPYNKSLTLDDIYKVETRIGLVEGYEVYGPFHNILTDLMSSFLPPHHEVFWNLYSEVSLNSYTFSYNTTLEFISSVANVTLHSLSQDLNVTCGQYLNWKTIIKNTTCVGNWLKKWMEVELKKATEETLKKFSTECGLQFCSRTRGKVCNSALGEKNVKNNVEYIYDTFNVLIHKYPFHTIHTVLRDTLLKFENVPTETYYSYENYADMLKGILVSAPSIEPIKYSNILRSNVMILTAINHYYQPHVKSREEFSWGIIRSSRGKVEDQCLTFRDNYPVHSDEFHFYSYTCYKLILIKSYVDHLLCSSAADLAAPLSWSTAPSFFVHSACLCVAFNSTGCRVKAPEGVPLLTHCFTVLLRDFQKQVTVRPALTYADYSFMTKVPTCQFTGLLQQRFYRTCQGFLNYQYFVSTLSVQCSFYGLVNETLNCTEMSIVTSANMTFLCDLYLFLSLVHCDADEEASVAFYSPGASPLVQVLTWLDVSVRLLTLVTFLACPQLRNLPGKLLVGYQVTALLRLLVAVAGLEDLAVAVRLDVSSDLSSSLWLSSFLHFLTSSFKTLRTPDSLSPREARDVLLRYSSLGWLVPAALSASFFLLDEATWSHVQVGQLLFVLCYFAALLWNLHMFYFNCKFYYDVKKDVVSLRPGAKPRGVFAGLLNVALKTSVLSGAGIIFRLLFAQVQGLEELLGYYHALGSLQGLLVFLFYGCSRESRDFWRRVLVRKLLPCPRPPPNRVV